MARKPLFPERYGFAVPVLCSEQEPLPGQLRNVLWTAYYTFAATGGKPHYLPGNDAFWMFVWSEFMHRPIDEFNSDTLPVSRQFVKDTFYKHDWTRVFAVIEFTFIHLNPHWYDKSSLQRVMNEQLSDYSSTYRIIGDEFVPISDEEQVKEIERALDVPLKPVKEHLKKSLHVLKDPSPTAALDSIRESIHAVESMCKILTKEQNDSLGEALNKVKGKMTIPKELEQSLHRLYGFTSNAQGVRHAVFDEPNLTLREARFMLVACSVYGDSLWIADLTSPEIFGLWRP